MFCAVPARSKNAFRIELTLRSRIMRSTALHVSLRSVMVWGRVTLGIEGVRANRSEASTIIKHGGKIKKRTKKSDTFFVGKISR